MKIEKMSIAKMQGKLSRNEMKKIMAGSGSSGSSGCATNYCGAKGEIPCCSSSDHCTSNGSSWICKSR